MRFANRSVPVRIASAVLAVLLCGAAAVTDAPQGSEESAVWTPKQLHFTYQGFTAHYSCDGLRDKVRAVLLKLGARKDLQVTETACAGDFGRPTPFPGVNIQMHVLQPASGKSADVAAAAVPARWHTVDLTGSRDPVDAAGDCELIEQIKQRILPKFSTRNVEFSSTCIPNQLTVGGTRLKAEVLMADQRATPPGVQPPRAPPPAAQPRGVEPQSAQPQGAPPQEAQPQPPPQGGG